MASIRGGVVAKVVIGSTRPWPTTLTGPLLGIEGSRYMRKYENIYLYIYIHMFII